MIFVFTESQDIDGRTVCEVEVDGRMRGVIAIHDDQYGFFAVGNNVPKYKGESILDLQSTLINKLDAAKVEVVSYIKPEAIQVPAKKRGLFGRYING